MNLLFFTIELERGRGGMGPEIQGGPRKRLAECVHLVRSSWRLQQHSACVRQAQRFGRSATGLRL